MPFKVPKDYVAVSELPVSPAGKILKREVKKQFLEGAGQPGMGKRQ
jgi:acyl-coenzyme A synthetase/AMP-(fatty) acid ligase